MSDATLPPDDELVSAHLDGEATPAESARVLADPAAAARVAELAAIRDLVAAPVTPPGAVREAELGAALALYDDLQAAPLAGPGAAPGPAASQGPDRAQVQEEGPGQGGGPAVQDDELAARRATAAAKARRASRNGKILAVAAVVVVALAGIGVIVRSSRTTGDTLASTTAGAPTSTNPDAASGAASSKSTNEQTADAGNAGAERDPTAARPAPSTPPTTAPVTTAGDSPTTTVTTGAPIPGGPGAEVARSYAFQPESLGTVSTPAQLRARVVTAITADDAGAVTVPSAPGGQVAAAQSLAAVSTCDAEIRSTDREVGPIVFSAPVTYNGTNAVVLVYSIDRAAHPAANGSSRLYAVDAATCAVLDVQTS